MDIRVATASDSGAIRALLTAAFGGTAEADLVEKLLGAGDIVLALVAQSEPADLVGYGGFVRLEVETDGRVMPAIGLAPLAVRPAEHRRGIGTTLVRHGLAHLADRGEALAFVVGDPAYYVRFDFSGAAAASFESRYSGPHFLARRLRHVAPHAGRVRYPQAFASL